MEKYLIYVEKQNGNREYIYYIQRNSVSKSEDIGDAIEFIDEDMVKSLRDYLNTREEKNIYKILCIKTTSVEIE